jgi:VIT1/CCC1 family predicted Fe2+/Mn2+ transporter
MLEGMASSLRKSVKAEPSGPLGRGSEKELRRRCHTGWLGHSCGDKADFRRTVLILVMCHMQEMRYSAGTFQSNPVFVTKPRKRRGPMQDRHLEHSHDPKQIAERLKRGPSVSYLRDWVYGGIDGAITNFAIVAGAVGADLSTRVVLILGIVNILADGFSMAAANFSSTRTEIEEYQHMRTMEERHIALNPDGEREDVRQIFRAKGFTGQTLDGAVNVITSEKQRWIDTMMTEEHGLPVISRSPLKAAIFTFLAFLLCGLVPIAPFALGLTYAGTYSFVMTAIVFLAIGSVRSLWSPRPWWHTGIETLTIGAIAAVVAYAAGDFWRKII